jgi:hypothetical protein
MIGNTPQVLKPEYGSLIPGAWLGHPSLMAYVGICYQTKEIRLIDILISD